MRSTRAGECLSSAIRSFPFTSTQRSTHASFGVVIRLRKPRSAGSLTNADADKECLDCAGRSPALSSMALRELDTLSPALPSAGYVDNAPYRSRSLARAVGRNGLPGRMGIARLRDVPRSAPSMLNIEHLRKQAKLYLRWHREHYYPVAARIRAVLPRYSRLTDREILARPFRLSDAQELVARTVGFENWDALRRGSHFVTPTRTGTLAMPTLVAAEPQLFVRDVVVSSEFYSRKLG